MNLCSGFYNNWRIYAQIGYISRPSPIRNKEYIETIIAINKSTIHCYLRQKINSRDNGLVVATYYLTI